MKKVAAAPKKVAEVLRKLLPWLKKVALVSKRELFLWYVKTTAPVMKEDATTLKKVVPLAKKMA